MTTPKQYPGEPDVRYPADAPPAWSAAIEAVTYPFAFAEPIPPALTDFVDGVQYAVSFARRLHPAHTGALFSVQRSSDGALFDVEFDPITNLAVEDGLVEWLGNDRVDAVALAVQGSEASYVKVVTPPIAGMYGNLSRINGFLAAKWDYASAAVDPAVLRMSHSASNNMTSGGAELAVYRARNKAVPYGTLAQKGTGYGIAINNNFPEAHGFVDGNNVSIWPQTPLTGNKINFFGHDWTPGGEHTGQHVYMDGVLLATGYVPPTMAANTAPSQLGMGSWTLQGQIGEYILLNPTGISMLADITAEVMTFWNEGALEVELMHVGDSIARGVGASAPQGWDTTTSQYSYSGISGYVGKGLRNITNLGVDGRTMSQLLGDVNTHIAAADDTKDRLIVTIMCVVNGFVNDDATPEEQYLDLIAYIEAFRTAKPTAKFVVVGPIPGNATFEFQHPGATAKLEAFRDLMLEDSSFADGFADPWPDFLDYADVDDVLFDGLHPNDIGHGIIARRLEARVNALI